MKFERLFQLLSCVLRFCRCTPLLNRIFVLNHLMMSNEFFYISEYRAHQRKTVTFRYIKQLFTPMLKDNIHQFSRNLAGSFSIRGVNRTGFVGDIFI